MEEATEKGEGGVPTEGLLPESNRGGSGTGRERDGGATAETETKVESKGRRVKTGSEGGVREAERGPARAEAGSAPVLVSHLIAQGRSVKAKR